MAATSHFPDEKLPAGDLRAEFLELPPWRAIRASGELLGPEGTARLEPRVMDLLFLLAERPGEVFSREEIQQSLWPGAVVGEDALARLVFKLRKALGDDPKAPRFVETLPKRGYRLRRQPLARAEPAEDEAGEEGSAAPPRGRARRAAGIAALLLLGGISVFAWRHPPAAPPPSVAAPATAPAAIAERANDFYFQYSKADNEAAIELFERLVGSYPDYAPGYAGLANALVQRVMRWPAEPPGVVHKNLRSALADGHLELPAAGRTLDRAEALARHALTLAPDDSTAHKAYGFVRSARGDFAGALAAYRRAVELDPDAWGPLINLGDVSEIAGRDEEALAYFEQAYAAMTRAYDRETPRIQPWYAELATVIGDRHLAKGRPAEAETWYRRALEFIPLHPAATAGLAKTLRAAGDPEGAARLCAELKGRLGSEIPCL